MGQILLMPNPIHPPKRHQKKGFHNTLIQSILSTNLVASFSGYTETTSRRQYMTGKPKQEFKNQVVKILQYLQQRNIQC